MRVADVGTHVHCSLPGGRSRLRPWRFVTNTSHFSEVLIGAVGIAFLLSSCNGWLMGVEPLPNIRDGILVERLVKTLRYEADVRRFQDLVQRPEGVRRS